MWVKVTLWSRPKDQTGAKQVPALPADMETFFRETTRSTHALSLWRDVSVMHVDPGNRASFWSVIGDLCLTAPAVYFVLPLLRGDLQITSVGMKDKTRPGIPREQSRLPRRWKTYAATVCFLTEKKQPNTEKMQPLATNTAKIIPG